VRRNFTPFAPFAGRPSSVTAPASFASSHTVAVVFGGTVTSSVNVPPPRFHEYGTRHDLRASRLRPSCTNIFSRV